MKTVFIVRHGKAVSGDFDEPDYNRVLAERGINDAFFVSRHLRKAGITPAVMISSPAPRALQTADIFARHLNYTGKILTRKAIYEQGQGQLLRILHEINDECDSVMLFGHNPSFTSLAQYLSSSFDDDMPTCAVVCLVCDINSWKDIYQDSGDLELYIYPKAIQAKFDYKSLGKDLEKLMAKPINEILSEVHGDAAKECSKAIDKQAQKTIGKFVKQVKKHFK